MKDKYIVIISDFLKYSQKKPIVSEVQLDWLPTPLDLHQRSGTGPAVLERRIMRSNMWRHSTPEIGFIA